MEILDVGSIQLEHIYHQLSSHSLGANYCTREPEEITAD